MEGLVLINVDPCAEGWMDWAASKVSKEFEQTDDDSTRFIDLFNGINHINIILTSF